MDCTDNTDYSSEERVRSFQGWMANKRSTRSNLWVFLKTKYILRADGTRLAARTRIRKGENPSGFMRAEFWEHIQMSLEYQEQGFLYQILQIKGNYWGCEQTNDMIKVILMAYHSITNGLERRMQRPRDQVRGSYNVRYDKFYLRS